MFVPWFQQRAPREYLNGASNKPPGRHQIQNAEGPVLDPCAKQIYFRRDPKVDPLRIESGPSWRACFWSLHFVRCAEALQAAMCAKCQAWSYSNTNSIRGRNLELFEALVANSSLLWCVTLMFVAWFQQRASREYLNGASNKPPGRHQIQNAEGPVLDPCAKQIYFRKDPKVDLLGSKVVPPGGPVFGPFILSDVLKLCKLLCAQNVKLEATFTQTASVAGILNCSRPWLPTRSCYDVWRWCLSPDSNNAPQESIWMGRQTSPQGGTRFRMLRAQFGPLRKANIFQKGPKSGPS